MINYDRIVGKEIEYHGAVYTVVNYKPGRKWHALDLADSQGRPMTLKLRFGYDAPIKVLGEGDKEVATAAKEKISTYKRKKQERQTQARQNWYELLVENSGHSQQEINSAVRSGRLIAYVRVKGYSKPQPWKVDRISAQGFFMKNAVSGGQLERYLGLTGGTKERYVNGRYVEKIEIKEA